MQPQQRGDVPVGVHSACHHSARSQIQSTRSQGNFQHCDLLDNLAVQIMGTKRFYLAHPGAVKQAGMESRKYDAWARLSLTSAEKLAAGQEDGAFVVADLAPGDVLYVPGDGWHEVVNLTPGVLLSGFFGPRTHVLSRWAWVQAREGLHRAGLLGRGHCTCHAGRAEMS